MPYIPMIAPTNNILLNNHCIHLSLPKRTYHSDMTNMIEMTLSAS
jgi:hypothetical protein